MNKAFRYYGKQPSVEMEAAALQAQANYDMTDIQMAGALNVFDFFCSLASIDAPISNIAFYDKRSKQTSPMPAGAVMFFGRFGKCSEAAKWLNPHSGHLYFDRIVKFLYDGRYSQSEVAGRGEIVRTNSVKYKEYEYAETAS